MGIIAVCVCVCVCVCVHEKRWEDLKRKGGRIFAVAVAVEVTYVDDWMDPLNASLWARLDLTSADH